MFVFADSQHRSQNTSVDAQSLRPCCAEETGVPRSGSNKRIRDE
jgi:hypothetical protein